MGFSGWRFDFVKGYAPDFMNDYIGKTVSQEVFNVGEFWVDLRYSTNSRSLIIPQNTIPASKFD